MHSLAISDNLCPSRNFLCRWIAQAAKNTRDPESNRMTKKILGWIIFLAIYIMGYYYIYSQGLSGPNCKGAAICFDVFTPAASLIVKELYLFLWLILFPIFALSWVSVKRKFGDRKWTKILDWIMIVIGILFIVYTAWMHF